MAGNTGCPAGCKLPAHRKGTAMQSFRESFAQCYSNAALSAILCAMSFDKNKIVESYKGFDFISVTDVPDNNAAGIYLRHRKTGLEVFHLLNDDSENLFAFAFRTPIKNATGAAHILEHSVFCGSERFPLKEPFANMMNQSVNTYLNAYTCSDKTVYPASSMVKADYFNLMDVYGDAVFFPLLKKEAFMQEAHRLELDADGKFSIQGVVYNEMKGNYSSFESVAADVQLRSLFPDTNYAFDSGGDPAAIPFFSYDDFKAFHQKYYRPDNCLVFLCGNIATEEQLDFLQERFLDRLEQKYAAPAPHTSYPAADEEFTRMETPAPLTAPLKVSETAPDGGATGATVTVNWLCGQTKNLDELLECTFLAEVLVGHDGSPLARLLTDSQLGDDLAPLTGTFAEMKDFIFSLGLHGVQAGDEDAVYDLIFSGLKELCAHGIDRKDLDAALMAAEFANREVVRAGGPYALVLLERTLAGWNYGGDPASHLLYRAAFQKIKENAERDDGYAVKLIKKYILENNQYACVCVTPSASYLTERDAKEAELTQRLSADADRAALQAELQMLHAYQQKRETAEECACIPRLKLSDLSLEPDGITTEIAAIKNGVHEIPLFKNTENTNGIAYLELYIPVDVLPPEEYPYLPLFTYCAANAGWNGKHWAECAADTAVLTGGIEARLVSFESARTADSEQIRKNLERFHCVDRDYLIFSVRMIAEKAHEAIALFSEAVSTFEFTDLKRLKNLCAEAKSALFASVVPKGNKYALVRAQCPYSHSAMAGEIWRGISQVFSVNAICAQKPTELAAHFERIKCALKDAGALLHVTADAATMQTVLPELERLAAANNVKPLLPRPNLNESDFQKLCLLDGETEFPAEEVFIVPAQVGYCASALPGTFFGTKENAHELAFAHWISGAYLWERIRTTGGAYGARASSVNLLGKFTFSTFRDPVPFQSLRVFTECLADAAEAQLQQEDCENIITGTYGDEVQPFSPAGRGNAGFMRMLCCISETDRLSKLQMMFEMTPRDIQEAAKRILAQAEQRRNVVICGKAEKTTGVIISLPV